VLRIIAECHQESLRLLLEYRPQLDALAKALLDRETLDEDEILKVTGLAPAPEIKSKKKLITCFTNSNVRFVFNIIKRDVQFFGHPYFNYLKL
jgi:hypothetical protein